jgi:enoyl-CoA hydratase
VSTGVNGVAAGIDGGVLRLELDKPERRNAVDTPMLCELRDRLGDAADDSVRVVLLTGRGPSFCAGGDLTGENTDGAVYAANEVVQAITELPKPVVAAVRGAASGFGCTLALSCDLVVAERSAFFQLAFVNVGLMPDGGTSALLPVAIGRARAARLALLGEKITAETAFEWGMISHLADDGDDGELEALLQTLAGGPTMAYGLIKSGLGGATLGALPGAQTLEAEGQMALKDSADFRERVRAFRSRRRR